jgi:glucose/arabinose dehydrogenase
MGTMGLTRIAPWAALAAAAALAGCGQKPAPLPSAAGFGASPELPAPQKGLLPTVNFAKAVGWPAGMQPTAAPGLAVAPFAKGLAHPRWLLVLPNGDVLVAETDGPDLKPIGFRGWLERQVMKQVGAETHSPNKIILLRGLKPDGSAESQTVFLSGLNSPFGMALVGDTFYVANTDAVMAFPYHAGDTAITAPGVKLVDLPGGPIDHHWTKSLIASPDGTKLYVTVGSNSNVGENGMAAEAGRAAIWEVDRATGQHRIFASGLRNPNGMDFEPTTGVLWTAVNERDELGDDLVPDYMTSVKDGAFYGWPYSYYGQHVDTRVKPQRPDLVAKAIAPDYVLGSHTASLGLVFYRANLLPKTYAGGVFIGQHGSWNRSLRAGYKVIFVPFANGKPAGPPQDVLTGFLSPRDKDQAYGRPVGVAVDSKGALLVADDVGNTIWRVTPKG